MACWSPTQIEGKIMAKLKLETDMVGKQRCKVGRIAEFNIVGRNFVINLSGNKY